MIKNYTYVLFFFLILLSLYLMSCRPRGEEENILETLAQMKDFTYKGKPVPRETIEELRNTILMFEEKIEDAVKVTGELGLYYKMLAKRYLEIEELKEKIAELKQQEQELEQDSPEPGSGYRNILIVKYVKEKMLYKALENLHLAIEINPENPILFYLAGNCAARVAKSMVVMEQRIERDRNFSDAYAYYKRAIELDPGYVDALKGMSVLLIFELGRPDEAESFILRILEKEKRNTEAMALLARVYFEQDRFEDAKTQYENIVAESSDKQMIEEAKKNIQYIKDIVGELY
ncbi:MAG: tetratricopeptide repeat protein [Spirochaetales bacterium]|nr:tetratricopeptide repeat protein [Spirochaetales bacterium]